MRSVFVLLILTFSSNPLVAAPANPSPSEQAVIEYLALRQSGNPHRPSLAKVREKFQISDDEFEKAASRVAAQGYSRDDQPDRQPSSKK